MGTVKPTWQNLIKDIGERGWVSHHATALQMPSLKPDSHVLVATGTWMTFISPLANKYLSNHKNQIDRQQPLLPHLWTETFK